MLALELLRYAAGNSRPTVEGRLLSLVRDSPEREIRWLVDGGLGPLLYHATREFSDKLPAMRHEILLSAHLTAQVRHGALIDCAADVIAACGACEAPVTLLKGISTSSQLYPKEHLRPMSDIDVLIPVEKYSLVESELLGRSYRRGSDPPMEDPHHGIPLVHQQRRVWIELHTSLYPPRSELMGNRLYSLQNIAEQTVAATYHDRPVRRLSDELQLIYIASSWVLDLTLSKIHPSFLPALFDAVYLLKSPRRDLDWNEIMSWLDNELAAASLYVMLSYLAQRRVYTAPIISSLRARQTLVGAVELPIVHAMLDRYLIGARRWNLFLPPPVPGRYNLRRQLRKRWSRRQPAADGSL